MAYVKKGYIGDSSVNTKLNNGNTKLSSGTVYQAYGGVGTGGQNLRDQAYPNYYSSSTGVAGANRNTGNTRSTGSTSTKSSSATNMANAYNALLAAYKQNDYSDYLRQMREAAQGAYDRGMSALNSAYDAQMNSLSGNLDSTRSQLADQYNRSKQSITDDANESLRQAYINKMLSQRNLGQQMTAQGLTGGATETTMANMLNNYGNARNNINTTQNRNLSNLEGNYNDNLAQALQAYNSAVANANLQKAQQAMSLENALANNQISALGDYQTLMQRENQNYLDLLKSAIANGASFSYDPTAANNAVKAVAVQQAANPNLVNNYATIQELMGGGNTPGVNTPGVTVLNQAANNGTLNDWIKYLQAI